MSAEFEAGGESAALLAALHATSFDRPWPEEDFVRLLASAGVRSIVLRRGDHPAGFALIRAIAGEAELLTICVRPDHRRSGAGRTLLSAAESAARAKGATRLFLEVSEVNAGATALYAASGYRRCGRRRAYYRDGSDAVLMDKVLA